MKKSSLCLFGGALLGAGLAGQATADVTVNGALGMNMSYWEVDFGSYSFQQGYMDIDTIDFTVLSDGYVTFDILSHGVLDYYFDSQLRLFNNDGNPLGYGNMIADNNNLGSGYFDLNGSTSSFDSFLEVYLTAGEYTIAVGAYWFGADQAEAGEGFGDMFGMMGLPIVTDAEYQLDIYGNVAVAPAPGAIALLGLGGLMGVRRRR